MKYFLFSACMVLFLFACDNKTSVPNVSDVKVDVKLDRFEKSFFTIDSNNLPAGLMKVRSQFPDFYPDFMQNILGVSGSDNDTTTLSVTKKFLSSYSSFASELEKKFGNTTGLEQEIRQGFQYVKYYFPDYKMPKLITYIGTLDAPGVAMTRNHIAIGLQQFAGNDFQGYYTAEVAQMFPAYITRRFDAKSIPANCMKAVVDDLFPDKSN